MVSNLYASDCENDVKKDVFCVEDYITIFTLANKKEHEDLNKTQAILGLVTVLLIMAFFHYIRLQYRKIVAIEDIEMTPSDFTLRLDGLTSTTTDDEIRKKIESLGEKLEVRYIFRTYKIGKYIQWIKKLDNLKHKLKHHKDNITLKASVDKWEKKVKKAESKKLEYGATAFIMFNTSDRKNPLRYKTLESDVARLKLNKISFRERLKLFFTQGKLKICQRAPEPNEVLWENIGVSSRKKNIMKIISAVLTVLVIGAAFGIIIGLNVLQVILFWINNHEV